MKKINRTRKNHTADQIHGSILEEKAGWISLHIHGLPFDRGYAHGYLLANQLHKTSSQFAFALQENIKTTLASFTQLCKTKITPIMKKSYPEYFEEIRGISAGARRAGVTVSVDFLVAWNSYMSLYTNSEVIKKRMRCSAFIATGSATEKGDIVMAHNTHCDFVTGQLCNIVMKVTPTEGHEFVMQTLPGLVASSTDWFVGSNGIIGCETTIAYTDFDTDFVTGHPYFCRIRKSMQYADSLDDCYDFMVNHNAGDYACSWLFGNINDGEIMLLELGLKEHNVKRTHNGVFHGMNSAMGFKLRSLETVDYSHDDTTTSVGSRNNRLDYLLNDKYKGKINITNAKAVLSDHYDGLTHKNEMGGRSICVHRELDESIGYKPGGCVDGKVVNSSMAEKLKFYGRFGSSCGRVFNVKHYLKEHPEHKKYEAYLVDFPNNKWVIL
jgi:hypothetical protein